MMKLDKRRKYYMILDCETATLPCVKDFDESARKNIAIAKPLIYDLGWQIIDRQGRIYAQKNYLITEIFSVPSVFNTAYYAEKKPFYIEMLKREEIKLIDWQSAINDLLEDIKLCYAIGAYNSMFDFKKAIPFTEKYINALYSPNYYEFERKQKYSCECIAKNITYDNTHDFDGENFCFRGEKYPMFDVWGMACEHLLNCDEYKRMCIDNEWKSASGKYFTTSAERAYCFLKNNVSFIESHTALDDAKIESEIFAKILKPTVKNLKIGITYFPFRILGKVENFEY